MDKNTKNWQGETGGGRLGQKGLILLLKMFNVRFLYFLLYFVVPFYMLFSNKAYLANFRFFYKRMHFSLLKSFGWTYKSHLNFGKSLIDRFAVFAGLSNKFSVEISGKELYEAMENQDAGCVLTASHIGNFEILGYLMGTTKKTIHSLIYQDASSEFQKQRELQFQNQNLKVIPLAADLQHIFELTSAASKGEIISMHCDRSILGNKTVPISFLGKNADFSTGAFQLIEKYNLKALFVSVIKKSAYRYSVYIEDIKGTSLEETMHNYVHCLEKHTRLFPDHWFNFYNFWNE